MLWVKFFLMELYLIFCFALMLSFNKFLFLFIWFLSISPPSVLCGRIKGGRRSGSGESRKEVFSWAQPSAAARGRSQACISFAIRRNIRLLSWAFRCFWLFRPAQGFWLIWIWSAEISGAFCGHSVHFCFLCSGSPWLIWQKSGRQNCLYVFCMPSFWQVNLSMISHRKKQNLIRFFGLCAPLFYDKLNSVWNLRWSSVAE